MRSRILAKLRAKLASVDGETLVETLVSTLIMSLVMLMLCTAIVSAAKINATAEENNVTFNQTVGSEGQPKKASSGSAEVTHSDNTTSTISADAYVQNGYVYYEPASSN